MPSIVEIPGVGEVEFPDSITDDQIAEAAGRLHREANPPSSPGLLDRAKAAVGSAVSALSDWDNVKRFMEAGAERIAQSRLADAEAGRVGAAALSSGIGSVAGAAQRGLETISAGNQVLPGPIGTSGAADVARASAHPLTPTVQIPRVPEDPQRSEVGQIGAGVANVAANVVEGFLTPLGMATLGAGALGPAAQRALAAGFAVDMGRQIPAMAEQAGAALDGGSLQRKVEAIGNLAVTAGMAGLAAKHAATPQRVAAAKALARELDRAPFDPEALRTEPGTVKGPLSRLTDLPADPAEGRKEVLHGTQEERRQETLLTDQPENRSPSPADIAATSETLPPRQAEAPPERPTAGPERPATESDLPPNSPESPEGSLMGSPRERSGGEPAASQPPAAPAGDAYGLPAGTTPVTGTRMPVAMDRVTPGVQDMPGIFSQLERVMAAAGSRTPIRTGHMGAAKRWASGFYRPVPEAIRLQSAFNLPTAAHEVAHSLAGSFFARPKDVVRAHNGLKRAIPAPVAAELDTLGKRLYGSRRPAAGYLEEGWAEYVRHWLTTDTAATVAPHTTRWFEGTMLPKYPEVAKELRRSREMIDVWRGQGARGRATAMMKPYDGTLAGWRKKLRDTFSVQAQVEQLSPLEEASKFWMERTGRPLSPGEDPYMVATRLRGIGPSVMDRFVRSGPVDIDGNPTGCKPLADVLGPLLSDMPGWQKGLHAVAPALARRVSERIQDWSLYLWARRTLERASKEQETGMSVDDAQHLLSKLDSPAFQLAAENYRRWWDNVLDYYAAAGDSNAELVARIRASSTNYVPLPRVLDERATASGLSARQGGGLHRMRGSGRPVYDVMESTLRVAERMIEKAHRDLVANTVIDLAQKPGMGFLVEKVPIDRVRQTVPIECVRRELEGLGVDLTGVPPDTILEWYAPATEPKGVEPVYVRKDGAGGVHWYALNPKVHEVIAGVDNPRIAAGMLPGVLAWANRTFKMGTTGIRPAFNLVTNPLRDVQNFWMQVNGTANPARALYALTAATGDMLAASLGMGVVKPSGWWEALHDLGVPMANSVAHDISQTRSALRGAWHGTMLHAVTHPINSFREMIGGFESVPREAQLRILASEMGWQPGMRLTRDQAVALTVAAKRVTTDFTAGGTKSREWNMYVPFYNAAVQGARAFGRTLRSAADADYAKRVGSDQRQALGRVAMGGAFLMALGLGNWLRNRDKEWYRALPWRERFLFTNIQLDDGTVARVPRPVEWGNLFMVLPEALADSWYQKDPETAVEAIKHIVDTMNPAGMPVPLNAALEQAANRDFFWDRPIVPRGEIDLPPGEQRNEYTSWLAKTLGQAFPNHVSPRRVDAAIRQFGGGAASDFIQAIGLKDQLHPREWEPSDLPVVGTLFRRGGTYSAANRYLNEFQDQYAYFNSRNRSKDRPLDAREEVFFKRMQEEKEQLDLARDIARVTKELQPRQTLYRLAGERARSVVEDAKRMGLGK